jgi:membrane protein DedA with SNARE-associated domain
LGLLDEFFKSLGGFWAYCFLFFCSLGENLFPPLPGDTVVILSSFGVGRGHLKFLPVFVSTTFGSCLGFMILYLFGLKWGRKFIINKCGRVFSPENLLRVEALFDKYGYMVLCFNRFLAGFRSVISLAAGLAGMDPIKVFSLAFLSCIIWNGFLIVMGVWIGENWALIICHYQRAVFILLLLLVLIWWFRYLLKKKLNKI